MPDDKTTITRSYSDATGGRTTLRLDAATWAAVDFLAKRRGFKSWTGWVHYAPTKHLGNRHADIREAVSAALLQLCQPLEIQPNDVVWSIHAPLLAEAQTLTDAEFTADLDDPDTFVDGVVPLDFGGFVLRTGYRMGRHCFWIENSERGKRHLVLPIPRWVTEVAEINANSKAPLSATTETSSRTTEEKRGQA